MSKAKPCLGYPSRTAAAIALRAEGMDTSEIALRIGAPPANISSLLSAADRSARWKRGEVGEYSSRFTIELDEQYVPAFLDHAARRAISLPHLAERILEIVFEDNLFDALLDDADELERVSSLRAVA